MTAGVKELREIEKILRILTLQVREVHFDLLGSLDVLAHLDLIFAKARYSIEIKCIELAVQTYYPLVYAEFFSGTRRFDGRKYGKKIEDSCGPEVLRRVFREIL